MRERLIELISEVQYMGGLEEKLADHLLAHGVIVLPCAVGDTVYFIPFGKRIVELKVARIAIEPIEEIGFTFYGYGGFAFDNRDFGKTVFRTKEEAEKSLAERSEGK